MRRNITTNALILRTRRIGEYHKLVTCLTPALGLVDALAYGAYKGKSKLSGITEPYTFLSLHLYYNPVKKAYKVTEAEEHVPYTVVRGSLARVYRASLFSEIVLKSFGGGGDSADIFLLLKDAFFVLDTCSTEKMDFVVIQFLWRFLMLSGMIPDLNSCEKCSRHVGLGEILVYSPEENVFFCKQCGGTGHYRLNGGERRYLEYTFRQTFTRAVQTGLVKSSVVPLRQLLLVMVQNFLEYPLNSLKNNVL